MSDELNVIWRRKTENGLSYAICPKCHTQITYLIAYMKVYKAFPDTSDSLGRLIYKKLNDWDSSYIYVCPVCEEVIAEGEEARILFQEKAKKARILKR